MTITAFEALGTAHQFFVDCLWHETLGRPAQDYLAPRATPETWLDARFGYAPPRHTDQLRPFISDETMHDIGLLDDRGNEAMAGRVTFPWLTPAALTIVGLGGRRVNDSRNVPKYANSPDRPWFAKGRNVFGLDRAIPHIHQQGWAIIVEGPFDATSLWQHGWHNAVATVGAKITLTQLSTVAVFTDRIIVILDGDEGGRRGIETLTQHLDHDEILPTAIEVRVGHMPEGKDPAEATKEELDAVLAQTLPIQRNRKYLHSAQ